MNFFFSNHIQVCIFGGKVDSPSPQIPMVHFDKTYCLNVNSVYFVLFKIYFSIVQFNKMCQR